MVDHQPAQSNSRAIQLELFPLGNFNSAPQNFSASDTDLDNQPSTSDDVALADLDQHSFDPRVLGAANLSDC